MKFLGRNEELATLEREYSNNHSFAAEEELAKQLLSKNLSKTKKHYISLPTWNPKGRI